VPIPGTRKLEHLAENIVAASVALTPADLVAIDEAAGHIAIQGARLPESFESLSGR
jgi:aryl-alcohol dehydrogenase-like predicted oxidoreductase